MYPTVAISAPCAPGLRSVYGATGAAPPQGVKSVSDFGPEIQLHYSAKTLMFADVVESVRLMQTNEFSAVHRIRSLLVTLADEVVSQYKGRVLERRGDGLLIEFNRAPDAAQCAITLHRKTAEANASSKSEPIQLRIGIHSADLLSDEVAYYGHGINLAARITSLAQPGETVISSTVRAAITPGLDGDVEDMGECYLKHVEAPIRAYRLSEERGGSTFAVAGSNALPGSALTDLRPAIAVLPFETYALDPKALLVGDILADEVISSLARTSELCVISRLSTSRFRDRDATHADYRNRLGAAYVLSGSCHVSGDKVVLSVQLSDCRSGSVVWSNNMHGSLASVLEGGDELVVSVATSLCRAIVSSELKLIQTRALPTLEGFTLLLGAIGLMHRMQLREFNRARQVFEHLAERYPRHSAPLAWLALWQVFSVTQGWFDDFERVGVRAADYARRALDANSVDPLALTAHGLVHTNLLKQFDVARNSYNLALESSPNEAFAWLHRGTLSAFEGRGEDAVHDTAHALVLSPLDPWRYYYDSLNATAALSAQSYEKAVELARRSLRANCRHTSTWRVIAIASVQLGNLGDAREAVAKLRQIDPELTVRRYLARSPAAGHETGQVWSNALRVAGLPE